MCVTQLIYVCNSINTYFLDFRKHTPLQTVYKIKTFNSLGFQRNSPTFPWFFIPPESLRVLV